jgi:WD40 repeat protein
MARLGFDTEAMGGVELSQDGTTLAVFGTEVIATLAGRGKRSVGKEERPVLKLFDVPKGDLLATLHGHTTGVCEVAFSKNGSWLATSALRGKDFDLVELFLWDVRRGEISEKIYGEHNQDKYRHPKGLEATATAIMTGGKSPSRPRPIRCLTFIDDDHSLVHLRKTELCVWSVEERRELLTMPISGSLPVVAADPRPVAAFGKNTLTVVELPEGKVAGRIVADETRLARRFRGKEVRLLPLAFTTDGDTLVTLTSVENTPVEITFWPSETWTK